MVHEVVGSLCRIACTVNGHIRSAPQRAYSNKSVNGRQSGARGRGFYVVMKSIYLRRLSLDHCDFFMIYCRCSKNQNIHFAGRLFINVGYGLFMLHSLESNALVLHFSSLSGYSENEL